MAKTIVKPKEALFTAWAILSIVEIIIGAIWTRTEWLAYVIRDKDFNLWAPGHLLIGVAMLATCVWLAIKLKL